jgi:hypothetical protein
MTDDTPASLRKAFFTLEFNPNYAPTIKAGVAPSPEERIANALEYSAFQLGQINEKFDQLLDALATKR